MELVRTEKSLVWVCWRGAGLFSKMKEQSLVCVVQHYQYYAKMQKLGNLSVEISISFVPHSSKGAHSAGRQEWPRGMGSTAAPAPPGARTRLLSDRTNEFCSSFVFAEMIPLLFF